jgi:LuxR family transcriptional regulator, maltose regulon positive regulatory protein
MPLPWRAGARSPSPAAPQPPAAALLRQRLVQQLLQAPHGVWLGSPAASGKTVLAASAAQLGPRPCCWYQVDHADSDPGSFFHFLGRAAAAVGKRPRGWQLPVYGREVGPQLEDFARAWCRALFAHGPEPFVLVLDDWHWISETSSVQQVLAVLLDELPAGCRLWVLSRHAPPATLGVARLRGRLLTLGFDQLALTLDEAQALMQAAVQAPMQAAAQAPPQAPAAPAADEQARAERWLRWCEGWVGALVFALATGRREPEQLPAALPGDTAATVFGFLSAEVFERALPGLRTFMLRTAWLPLVTERLAQAGGDSTGLAARDAIAQLSHRGLLQAGAGAGTAEPAWRYHRLLREFLRQRSRSTLAAAELTHQLSIQAHAVERAGLPEAAADLWLDAATLDAHAAWPELAALLLRQAETLLASGRYATLEAWAEALPAAQRTPWVDFWWAQALLARDARLGYRQFEQAYAGFWQAGDAAGLYRSWCGVIEGITYACDDYGALELWLVRLRELRQRFPRYPSLLVRAQVSVYGFSATFFLRPQAPEFAPWLRNVRRLYRLALRRADRVAIGGLLGLYHASITGMDALGAHLRGLRPLLDDATVPPFRRLVGGLSDVIHHWIAGSTDDALARLAVYSRLASHTGAHAIDRQFAFHHVYVHCLRGELALAEQHLQRVAPELAQLGQIDVAQFHFLSGWLAALAGRTGEAVHLLEEAYANARVRRFALFEACSRGLLAELLASSGQHDAARRHAEGALAVAHEMGSVTARVACQMQRAAVAELAGEAPARLAGLIAQAFADARAHGHWAWGGLYPPTLARVAARALELGVETDFARELVRRRGLLPPAGANAAWPWAFKLRLFGTEELQRDSLPDPAAAPGAKAAQRPLELLHAVAAQAGAPLPVAAALQALWPEGDAADQRKAFDVALLRLRRQLGDDSLLRLEGGRLALDAQRCWSDVAALAQLLEQPLPRGSAAALAKRADAMLTLARGPLLPGLDTPWAQLARERWRQRLALAWGDLFDALQPLDAAAALSRLEAAFDRDPSAAALARRLMRLHAAAGRLGEAARVYRLAGDVQAQAGGLPLAPETRRLAVELGLQAAPPGTPPV